MLYYYIYHVCSHNCFLFQIFMFPIVVTFIYIKLLKHEAHQTELKETDIGSYVG
jgi:hypothetical protein